jgi:hypothetical protein
MGTVAMTTPAGYRHCPTDREDVELRVRSAGSDLLVVTYRRKGHDLGAVWAPGSAVSVPRRYARVLAECILAAVEARADSEDQP